MRRFWFHKSGNVATIMALTAPLFVGALGLGIEVGLWRYDQARLQQAADASAYAAAVAARVGSGSSSDAASAAAALNGFAGENVSITLNKPSTTTPSDPNSIEAVLSHNEVQLFSAFFHVHPAVLTSRATASYTDGTDACILALSRSASKAVDFSGNSTLKVDGCSVMSDSLAVDALNMQGSSNVTAPCLYSAGGANQAGTLSLTSCKAVKTSQPPMADPYMSLAMPTVTGGCTSPGNGSSLSPGHYCSMSLKNGATSLAAGNYIIDGGTLDINANANVTGSGVTFFLVNGATVKINGTPDLQLSAPISGTYSGFLMVADRSNTNQIKINGDANSLMTGIVYAPAGTISFLGNFSGAGGCTKLVAQTIAWSGNTKFTDNCGTYGMGKTKIPSAVRLTS